MQGDANHLPDLAREIQDRFYWRINTIFLIVFFDYFHRSSLEPGKAILLFSLTVDLQNMGKISTGPS